MLMYFLNTIQLYGINHCYINIQQRKEEVWQEQADGKLNVSTKTPRSGWHGS